MICLAEQNEDTPPEKSDQFRQLAKVYQLRLDQKVINDLLSFSNVIGVGVGLKEINGKPTAEYGLRVHVGHKFSCRGLSESEKLPKVINGIAIDVIDSNGGYFAESGPVTAGTSVGHKDITCGTLGGFVKKVPDDGHTYIISNNHVFANCNDAEIGDECYWPGPADGGTQDDTIALLAWFKQLDYGAVPTGNCNFAKAWAGLGNAIAKGLRSSSRIEVSAGKQAASMNMADVALARLVATIDPDGFEPNWGAFGICSEVGTPAIGDTIGKLGRTTATTYGVVTDIAWVGAVGYGLGRTAWFDGQFISESRPVPWDVEYPTNFSLGGDSGSCICTLDANSPTLDSSSKIIGLLFAGNGDKTIATPMPRVFNVVGNDFGQIEFLR